MREHGAHLALFVIGRNAEGDQGRSLVREWRGAGHVVGNHTYSHRNYNAMSFEQFSADVAQAGVLLEPEMDKLRLFRFPMLKEGNTAEKRDAMREYLLAHGYRNGHVTIDASDWYFDSRLRKRLAAEPNFDVTRFRQPYIDHLWNRAQYYNQLAVDLLGRSAPHTLLVHYNLLNSLFLSDALAFFKKKGWRLVDASEAYQDPLFTKMPDIVPAGESLLWALAKQTGKFDKRLRYPGESDEYEKAGLDRLGL